MDGFIKYCIVKKYMGTSKKHPTNTHLFFIPIDPKKYMYLALIGKMTEDETENSNKYVAQLLVRLPEEIIENTIEGEKEYFKDRFVEIESLDCKSMNPSPGKYVINISKKGFNIRSNIEIDYQIEYSSQERKIYMITGDLNLVTGEVTDQDMKMVAAKQVAFLGSKKRFKEMINIPKKWRSKYYHD